MMNKPPPPGFLGDLSGREPCPVFYSDVRENSYFIPDDEVLECDSLDVAEREATQAAAEIRRGRLPKGDTRQVMVEVRNEHHQRVLMVTVSIELHWVAPTLEPPRV